MPWIILIAAVALVFKHPGFFGAIFVLAGAIYIIFKVFT